LTSSFLGWLLCGAIHIVFLAGVRNRFTTVATWLFTLGLNRRAERVITYGDGAPLINSTTAESKPELPVFNDVRKPVRRSAVGCRRQDRRNSP
jgi:hypothetical protein